MYVCMQDDPPPLEDIYGNHVPPELDEWDAEFLNLDEQTLLDLAMVGTKNCLKNVLLFQKMCHNLWEQLGRHLPRHSRPAQDHCPGHAQHYGGEKPGAYLAAAQLR